MYVHKSFSNFLIFPSHFRSRGEAKAMFLRHEGFLGALGAFTSYKTHSHNGLNPHHHTVQREILNFSGDNFRHIPVTSNSNDNETIECSINLV